MKTQEHLDRVEAAIKFATRKASVMGELEGQRVALCDSFQGRPIAAAGEDEDEVEITSLGILSENG